MKKPKKNRSRYTGRKNNNRLPTYDVIEAAIAGEEWAIYEIIKHYGNHIMRLSGREHFNNGKKNYYIVDAAKMDIIKISLIESIRKFNPIQ